MRNDLASIALRAVVRVMGELVAYRRRGEQWPVSGVFEANHVGLDPDTGVQVRSTQPALLIQGSALPMDPQQGDEVDVRGVSYVVRDSQQDGHGGWLLLLHRAGRR